MNTTSQQFLERWGTQDVVSVAVLAWPPLIEQLREYWPNATRWICPAGCTSEYVTPEPVDVVLCCDILQHWQNWRGILLQACGWLRPCGRLIVTCAGAGRAPHSAIDGEAVRSDEYYANLVLWELTPCIESAEVRVIESIYDPQWCDCRVVGERLEVAG